MSGIYRFINTTVPTKGCNLRCEYCYVRQWGEEDSLEIKNEKNWYKYPIGHMISSLTVERMGGICMFNFSAQGETLLSPYLFDIVTGLLKNGHYVAIISNCTITGEIDRYIELDSNLRDHLFFKASFHYRELKKHGLLNTYSRNIKKLKKSGVSFSVELVSNDYILEEIEEVKEYSLREFGALPHVLGGREETVKGKYPKYETKLDDNEFHNIWGAFQSPLFNFQDTEYLTPHNNDFCYAGVFTGTFDMSTGDFSACPGNRKVTNFFDDIDSPIQFLPVGNNCPFPFCFCGFFLQVLAGSCSESYDAKYKFFEFRDRECLDGSHWLTPPIREVFSHTCAEYHQIVTVEQRYYINTVLGTVYHGYDNHIDDRITEMVRKYFCNRKTGRVAIYGMSDAGRMFSDVAIRAGLNVVCAIDRKYEEIKASIPVISPESITEEINTVIVAAYSHYPEIMRRLRNEHPNIEVYSIFDLLLDYM